MSTLALVAAVFSTAIIWLYFHVTGHLNYWRKHNVPFAKPVPLFGNIFEVLMLRKTLSAVIEHIYNSVQTECVGFYMFHQPFLLVRDPQIIKQILIKDFEYFANRELIENKHDKLSSDLLFICRNPRWRSIRTKITPVFSAAKIKSMLPLVLESSKDLKSYLRNTAIHCQSTDVRDMSLNFARDTVLSCTLGISSNSFDENNAPFRAATERFYKLTIRRTFSMAAYVIAPILVRLLNLKFVEPVAGRLLHNSFLKHMKEREISKLSRGDLIDILIDLRKSSGSNNLDEDLLSAQPLQFVFAGVETTGSALMYALHCMAMHPKIQYNLRKEIKEVINQRGGNITYEVLGETKLLERVIDETLRLYPGLPVLGRRCTKTLQLASTDIVVEEGIPVYVSVMGLHYDPKYFPDPYKFDPDRFTDENKKNILSGTYYPFGDGPRSCIGSRFALMTLKVALIQILSDFEVEPCSTTLDPITFVPRGFLLTPTGDKLDLHFKEYIDSEDNFNILE